jgi:hypothetical protein
MKKIVMLCAATLAFVACTSSLKAQNGGNDQQLIGKARGAAHECLQPYLSSGIAVDATVETTGICFVSGELHKVTFYTTVRCNTEPCPRPASEIIAVVYFGCEDTVMSVECAN